MDLAITNDGGRYTVCVNEKLTAVNSSEFEAALKKIVEDADELVLDLSGMDYTSSAGLRVMLCAKQIMDERGVDMILRGLNDMVMQIFRETGFVNLFNIENPSDK